MTTVLLRCVDLETSKKDEGEVVEIGWTDVYLTVGVAGAKEIAVDKPHSILFRPEHGMHPGAQGVHHISMARVRDLQPCTPDDLRAVATDGAPNFLVAHNYEYERTFFTDEVMKMGPPPEGLRWICTFKAALWAWEEAPEHNLQALRYWRGLDLDERKAMPPHRAGPDSYVGAWILAELLRTERVRDLVAWTLQPRRYLTCPIGRWRGRAWTEIDHGFLDWIVNKAADMEADIKHAALMELERRRGVA